MAKSEWQEMLRDAPNPVGGWSRYVEYLFEVRDGTARASASEMALALPGDLYWKESPRGGLAKKLRGIRTAP
jgi:hypothetical protein